MTTLLIVAAALGVAVAALLLVPLWRDRRSSGRWSAAGVAAAVATPLVAWAVYSLVTTWDPDVDPHAREREYDLVRTLQARLEQDRPDDVEGWRLLGRSFMSLGLYRQAVRAFNEAYARSPTPANDVKGELAEAMVQSDPTSLLGRGGEMFEEILAESPNDIRALWYGGAASAESGRLDEALERWARLLDQNPPPQLAAELRQVVAQVVAMRDAGGLAPAAGAGAGAAGTRACVRVADAGDSVPGPTVRPSVRLGEGRSFDGLGPQAALFIFARSPAGGPPLAACVVRALAGALPGEFLLSEADAMMAGLTIGTVPEVTVVARVSMSGQPIEQAGDWYAEAAGVRPGSGTSVDLVIDRVVQ